MYRYSIFSYAVARTEIERGGLWDTGQIHPYVKRQLDWAVSRGLIQRIQDGFPLGGEGGQKEFRYLPIPPEKLPDPLPGEPENPIQEETSPLST